MICIGLSLTTILAGCVMGKSISAKKKAAVLKRDGGLCVLQLDGCMGDATVADHRVNRGHGGARSLDGFSNLVAACGLCNGRKEAVSGDERADLVVRGLRVEPGRTHAHSAERAREIPVMYADGLLYRLTDDGRRELA